MHKFFYKKQAGLTLIETLVATAIFVSIITAIYGGFTKILALMSVIRTKQTVTNLVNEQFEIVRNLPYASVGVVGGIPSGVITQNQTLVRDNKTFSVNTIVRNHDDPFDGTFGGSPNDLSPSDMKLVEVTVACANCANFTSMSFTTKIAPKNLETASTNGALVIRVFDSSGVPVPDASVNIVNSSVTPNINFTDTTLADGTLTIVDAPPSVGGYRITVTKNGYSTDRTYPVGGAGNPNPISPDVTVVLQQITQVSFTIDRTSTVPITTLNNQCAPTADYDFTLSGTKLIGTSPNTLKYSQALTSNGSGLITVNNLEWDTYNIIGTDSAYDIIGTNPLLSLGVPPNATLNMQLITAPKNGRRLVVVVRDQSTGLPVTDATVNLAGNSYNSSLTTSEGFFSQTDWSGGSGQSAFNNSDMYFDGTNVDVSTTGDLKLANNFGDYVASGTLTSSTFDTGATSNFKQILWAPANVPPQTGQNSVRFQIATNNDATTWNFVGPDGTSNTYFTLSNQNINSANNGDRYLRYKVFLSTQDEGYTPTISDISFTYTSDCIPPGQVSFPNLSTGAYTITVTKSGYQDSSRNIDIDSSWQKEEFSIAP